MGFAERLTAEVGAKRSVNVVGLDPVWEMLPDSLKDGVYEPQEKVERIGVFCRGIIDAIAPYAVAVKPQFAFFEVWGWRGMQLLEELWAYAHSRGLLVIGDGKRGDIGSTAVAYARAYLSPEGCDSLTVNPYLGQEGLDPFIQVAQEGGKGLFVLVRTSNPGAGELQDQGETPLAQRVCAIIRRINTPGPSGYGPVGAVVGATVPEALSRYRQELPQSILLLPGYGAQGAQAKDLVGAFHPGGLGAVVNSSRGILYASREKDWAQAAAQAARQMQEEIGEVIGL